MSDDDLFGLMRLFIAIADDGGIGAGARRLGLAQPSASRGLSRLERRLGVRLIERTTASFSLTEEGSRFLEDARTTLDAARVAVERTQRGAELAGAVVVAASTGIAAFLAAPLVVAFRKAHPAIEIELRVTDAAVAMLREGVDIWLRAGPLTDETLVARRLVVMPRLVVGHPEVSAPKALTDKAIGALPWIGFPPFYRDAVRILGAKAPRSVAIAPRLVIDNLFAVREALGAGPAVALLPRFAVEDALGAGRLKELHPALRGEPIPWSLALAPGKHRPARVQAVADWLFEGVRKSAASQR